MPCRHSIVFMLRILQVRLKMWLCLFRTACSLCTLVLSSLGYLEVQGKTGVLLQTLFAPATVSVALVDFASETDEPGACLGPGVAKQKHWVIQGPKESPISREAYLRSVIPELY